MPATASRPAYGAPSPSRDRRRSRTNSRRARSRACSSSGRSGSERLDLVIVARANPRPSDATSAPSSTFAARKEEEVDHPLAHRLVGSHQAEDGHGEDGDRKDREERVGGDRRGHLGAPVPEELLDRAGGELAQTSRRDAEAPGQASPPRSHRRPWLSGLSTRPYPGLPSPRWARPGGRSPCGVRGLTSLGRRGSARRSLVGLRAAGPRLEQGRAGEIRLPTGSHTSAEPPASFVRSLTTLRRGSRGGDTAAVHRRSPRGDPVSSGEPREDHLDHRDLGPDVHGCPQEVSAPSPRSTARHPARRDLGGPEGGDSLTPAPALTEVPSRVTGR